MNPVSEAIEIRGKKFERVPDTPENTPPPSSPESWSQCPNCHRLIKPAARKKHEQILRKLAGLLNELAVYPEKYRESLPDWETSPIPYTFYLSTENDPQLRVILPQPIDAVRSRLMERDLHIVGFFGKTRYRKSQDPEEEKKINEMDKKLCAALLKFDGILAYLTMRIGKGNYGNLVVLNDVQTREVWKDLPEHKYAADVLSPRMYTGIRLYNAFLPGGLSEDINLKRCDRISLHRAKFYCYEDAKQPYYAYATNCKCGCECPVVRREEEAEVKGEDAKKSFGSGCPFLAHRKGGSREEF